MKRLDPADAAVWRQVRATVSRAQRSSLHCSIGSISPDGQPHVSPIGSVHLGEPGRGVYLDVFNVQLGRNLEHDPHLTLLAVDSSLTTWLRALVKGRFPTAPGVRLVGTAAEARPATQAEIERFQRAVRTTLWTKGGRAMFGRTSHIRARDLTFTDVLPVRIGTLTKHLWRPDDRSVEAAIEHSSVHPRR
jgi:uncharacterized protein